MIVSRHKEARDVTRHAGRGTKIVDNNVGIDTMEIDGELVDVNDIVVETADTDLNISKELEEIVDEFDIDCSNDNPVKESYANNF